MRPAGLPPNISGGRSIFMKLRPALEMFLIGHGKPRTRFDWMIVPVALAAILEIRPIRVNLDVKERSHVT
jgi:hypothetical protein